MTTAKKVDGFMEQIFNAAIDEKLSETQVRARCAALSIRARATLAEVALGDRPLRSAMRQLTGGKPETGKQVSA